ncbi:hypothetical protein Zmor_014962 [Zophobas morio]|uniref:Uncharacterized protein n=1 Tax=Zophobas morio TaxID=2755281 RepID=A0AA38MGQ5_9CUCU|nr:hypothetical protein Zmor_014962 [Zophobas morio]
MNCTYWLSSDVTMLKIALDVKLPKKSSTVWRCCCSPLQSGDVSSSDVTMLKIALDVKLLKKSSTLWGCCCRQMSRCSRLPWT